MLQNRSYQQIRADLLQQKISCIDLVNQCLGVIDELNPSINAFLHVYRDEAIAQANEIDHRIQSGEHIGRLAGLVVGIKDLLCFKDHPLTGSSKILEGFESQYTATAVQRLIDEDAIIIGHQNCDEFGMGSSNENSGYGLVRNPIDQDRVPGGSSGGSAAAVASGMCTVSIGSDTGGSVRQPAAFCGVVGLKPTYSRISRYGLVAYASSFDVIGVLAHTTEDAALLLEIMAGEDEYDSTVSSTAVPPFSNEIDDTKKFRIGYIKESLDSEGLSEPIRESIKLKLNELGKQGYSIEELSFPYFDYLLATYYILITAESSSNLSRYDGVRYGHRSDSFDSLESMYKESRSQGFGEEVKRRILLGTFVLSASYYDAYYTKAQKARSLIIEKTNQLLDSVDLLITPTTPTTAFKLGAHSKHPIEMYLADVYTVHASVCGLPAISIPIGKDKEGLPIGFQAVGRQFAESDLLSFSKKVMSL